jgi:hypothetical protein
MQRRDMGLMLGTSRIHADYRTLPQNLLHPVILAFISTGRKWYNAYLVSDPEVPRDTLRVQFRTE